MTTAVVLSFAALVMLTALALLWSRWPAWLKGLLVIGVTGFCQERLRTLDVLLIESELVGGNRIEGMGRRDRTGNDTDTGTGTGTGACSGRAVIGRACSSTSSRWVDCMRSKATPDTPLFTNLPKSGRATRN